MVEKHFRCWGISKESPDYGVSADENRFTDMVNEVRRAEEILGDGHKRGPLECEMPLFNTCRRTAAKPLRG